MEFTYDAYVNMLNLLRDNGYTITGYDSWSKLPDGSKCVILRHDIDFEVEKAVKLAEIEAQNGVTSTYFVLITSDLYNAFSKRNTDYLRKIVSLGHCVGLHYDETAYPGILGNIEAIKESILEESRMLEKVTNKKVDSFSMHRPGKATLDADIQLPEMINSYGQTFFKEFKYISDSRKRWREPVIDIIKSGEYRRLHILTHAFWYDKEELSVKDSLLRYIGKGDNDRQLYLKENITGFDEIMNEQ